jgi:hypothetical protein
LADLCVCTKRTDDDISDYDALGRRETAELVEDMLILSGNSSQLPDSPILEDDLSIPRLGPLVRRRFVRTLSAAA